MSQSPPENPTRRMNSAPPSPPLDEATKRMGVGETLNSSEAPTKRGATGAGAPPLGTARPLGELAPGTILGGEYVVVKTHHNHESQRPGLFECQAPKGRMMVKIAATEHPPQLDLWQKLPLLDHPNVIRTRRVWEENGRWCEAQEFCEGGTLADLVPFPGSGRSFIAPEWVEESLVPAFCAGIAYLHAQSIVHRDIKPSNLYLRQENAARQILVIGDFDISSVLQTGRTSRATQRAAGTWTYSPPEAFPRFVDSEGARGGATVLRSSDYYSFGVVLVELLVGTTALHQSQLADLYDFYLAGGRIELPDDLSPRLRELLGGLLCRNRNLRWGEAEVARWMKRQTTDADRARIAQDGGFSLQSVSVAPFTAFEHSRPTNLVELARAMAEEPKLATEELFSGDVLLNWIGQIDAKIARGIRQDRETHRSQPQLALLCARLRLMPDAPLPITPQIVAVDGADWAKKAAQAVSAKAVNVTEICNLDSLSDLASWLESKASSEPQNAARVRQIIEANTREMSAAKGKALPEAACRLVLEELTYALLPSRPFLLAPHVVANTPDQIPALAYGAPEEWEKKVPDVYRYAQKRWADGALEAFLRQRLTDGIEVKTPLLEQMEAARQEFSDQPACAFERVLRLLDPSRSPVEIAFDTRHLREVVTVQHGQSLSIAIPFQAQGAGTPFARVRLQAQGDALMLETHEINARAGEITLRLHSLCNTPVGRDLGAKISLSPSPVARAREEVELRFRIDYSRTRTLQKMAVGALLGALVLGGTRGVLTLMIPQSLRLEHAALLNSSAWSLAFLTLLAGVFLAFMLWIWGIAYHKHD